MRARRSIRNQLLLPFVVIAVVLVLVGVVIYSLVSGLRGALEPLPIQQAQVSRAQTQIWMDEVLTQSLRNYILTKNAIWKNRYDEFAPQLDEVSLAAKEQASSPSTKAIFQRQYEANGKLVDLETQAFALVESSKSDEALALIDGAEYKKWKDIYSQALNEFLKSSKTGIQSLQENLAASISSSGKFATMLLAGAVIFGVLVILLGLAMARKIAGPLAKIVKVTGAIARGDLNAQLDVVENNEIGTLAESVRAMSERLRSMVGLIREVADSVVTASQELTRSAERLEDDARRQVTTLDDTRLALDDMTTKVKQNADHADEANQVAGNSRALAQRGGSVLKAAVESMHEISASSKKIVDISSTIDQLAFQTNLLALNAAVEAARAGEQGRGFAVVATEVRNLAQRSAAASKDIKILIQDTSANVDQGVGLVMRSGEELKGTIEHVNSLSTIIGRFADESRSQSARWVETVANIDNVMRANLGQTQDLSSTSISLNAQAKRLQSLLAQFQIDGDFTANISVADVPVASDRALSTYEPKRLLAGH